MADALDFWGDKISVGDQVEAYWCGEPFTCRVKKIVPDRPLLTRHPRLTLVADAGREEERDSDAVTVIEGQRG